MRHILFVMLHACGNALHAAPPQGGPEPLQVTVLHTATRVIHRYTVTSPPADRKTPVERVAIDTRGPFPVKIGSPRGWKFTAGTPPGRSAIWGCEWRVEWQLPASERGKPGKPVSGFVLEFVGKKPTAYCNAEVDFRDGSYYGMGGPDSVPIGVP